MQLDATPFQLARTTPLGVVDTGPVGSVDQGGRCEVAGVAARVSCWVGADDRWHVPEDEPSTRQGWARPAPVVRTTSSIPGGSVVTSAYAAVVGEGAPAVCLDVWNDSAIPVAIAYVVTSDRPLSVGAGVVAVDGRVVLRLTREALGFAAAATTEDLLAALERGDLASSADEVDATGGRVVAVVVPLPHTARSHAALSAAFDGVPDAVGPLARDQVPSAEQVGHGWQRHVEGLARLDVADARRSELYEFAVAQVVNGPRVGASAEDLAAFLGARARLGHLVGANELIADVLDFQRTNGRIDDGRGLDSAVRATIRWCGAVGALWAGGLERAVADDLVGPVAAAAHWLTRRRRRDAVAPYLSELAAAFRSVVPMLMACGQDGVAASLRDSAPADATTRRGDDRLATVSATAAGVVPALVEVGGASAYPSVVEIILDDVVRLDGVGVVLFAGVSPTDLRPQAEVHTVPVPAGTLSVAVRWHDRRPALLWECEPWPDRDDEPVLTAPTLDPSWRAAARAGEALLAEPPAG